MVKLKANSDVASPRNELTGITWLLTRVINITETPPLQRNPSIALATRDAACSPSNFAPLPRRALE